VRVTASNNETNNKARAHAEHDVEGRGMHDPERDIRCEQWQELHEGSFLRQGKEDADSEDRRATLRTDHRFFATCDGGFHVSSNDSRSRGLEKRDA